MRRLFAVGAFALAAVVATAGPASAHAVLASSDPADGAELGRAPAEVTATFTEEPDPKISDVKVFDATGRAVHVGRAAPVAGDPLSLRVRLGTLGEGVYTVSWKVLSRVDGHLTAGAFAFGVGVSPADAPRPAIAEVSTPGTSPLEVGGRWVLALGLVVLVGGGWVGAAGFREQPAGLGRLIGAGCAASVVGWALLGEAQRRAAGVGIGSFASTSVGRALMWRGAAIVVACAGVAAARSAHGRRRLAALAVTAVTAAGAMAAHVAAGHAAASGARAFQVAAQWGHFAAVGVWVGGLAALLVGVRGAPSEIKARAVRRFSFAAGIALAVVAATGTLRAWQEVRSWGALTSTSYGRVVLVKAGLLTVLVALGAVNRYRHVPRAAESLSRLRRVSGVELAIGAVAIGSAALLANLVPARQVKAGPTVAGPLVVSGSDFATSVRLRLEIAPGTAGPNTFRLAIADFDEGTPVAADRVELRFVFEGTADVGESTLQMQRDGTSWRAQGANLSLDGPWQVTVLIQRGADALEVPLRFRTRSRPQQIQVIPGDPTLYNVTLSAGRSVQFYVDPGRAGPNEVHATFFDAAGTELGGLRDITLRATPPEGAQRALEVRLLSPGHFVAGGELAAGRWRFDVSAATPDGTPLAAYFEETIEP